MAEPQYVFPVANHKGGVQAHWGQNEGGSDIFAPAGTVVYSVGPGKVLDASYSDIGGYNVTIQGADGRQYYYAHLADAPRVKAGQAVQAGTVLGTVGDTGNAKGTGAHLHIGIGSSIVRGTGPTGGTGADFDAVGFLNQLQGENRGTAGAGGEQPDDMTAWATARSGEDTPTGPTTGGTPMAGEVDTGVSNRGKPQQSNPILDDIFAKKGTYKTAVQTNSGASDVYNSDTKRYEPVPPTYRYQWDDGTYADVTADGKVTGTALQALKPSANKPTAPKISRFPDGTMRQYDPSTDTWDVVGEAPDVSASKQNAFTASQNQANRDLQKYMADLEQQIKQGQLTLQEASTQFNQGLANYQFKNQRQGMAGGLFNNANQLLLEGSRFAAPPNRNTFPGYGAGEGAAVASKLLGAKFTPLEFQRINFDPRGDVERTLTGGYDWPDIPGTVYPGYQSNWGGGGGLPTPPSRGATGYPPSGRLYSDELPQRGPSPNLPAPPYAGARLYPDELPQRGASPNLPAPDIFASYGAGQPINPVTGQPQSLPRPGTNVPIDPVTGQPLLPMPYPTRGAW